MMFRSIPVGCGTYLPSQVITNDYFSTFMETSSEWIASRTGILERRFASESETTSDMAVSAAEEALKNASIAALDVDAIIVATTTPDNIFPSVATIVQHRLGAKKAFAFDVQAVCSGFIYALSVADNMIRCGQAKTILVIGAESMSRILDRQDRTTAVLFGDGAGALVLQATNAATNRGILSTHLFSDGSYKELLYVDGGPGQEKQEGVLKMCGREIFKLAVERLGQAVMTALEANQLTSADIDWFIPHQANIRIINSVSEHFHLPREKVVITVHKHGNTSAASIPLALYDAVSDGRVKENDLIIFEAMGGGLTWGSALIRW
ncbi:beta-ketoacyl-ACP synthase III [Candidatus Paracaedibacter symbiosus]|uniref:beta-ketoacyl-ACP synthase III n=1 Tax=Candidatus Paracaedibacter symbiosus TaxID=244582 RepID=UPI0005097875|nr:beta-ketoacyl-ACP synthase III [Candidatus Paracaedibacter symbiosus]